VKRNDGHLEIRLAQTTADIKSAQRLRYQVFVQEMGAAGEMVDHAAGLEIDRFDAHCEHLILVDTRRDSADLGHVVGVYRMLDRDAANKAGGFYSQAEYDLSPLIDSSRSLLELGRSCVHPDYRNGMGLYRLWHGLGAYVSAHRIDVLFGVASFPGVRPKDHGDALAYLHNHHLAPVDLRVCSRDASSENFPTHENFSIPRAGAMATMPALIKAYLRIGGYVGDGAFVDHAFNTTDVCLILDLNRMDEKQRRRYGGGDDA